jgi:hypothetical protein
MKLRAPEGCRSISLKGRSLFVAADGSLDVGDDVASDLSAHGFTPWRGAKSCNVNSLDGMSREGLVAALMDLYRRNLEAGETEAIRAKLRALHAAAAGRPEETAIPDSPDQAEGLHDDDIESLNRSALFALLRRKGVRVTLPITNAQLRAAAKRAQAE